MIGPTILDISIVAYIGINQRVVLGFRSSKEMNRAFLTNEGHMENVFHKAQSLLIDHMLQV